MPYLYTRLTNATLQIRDEGEEYDTPELALARGIISALDIAVDEFRDGQANAAVDVSIESFDEVPVRRSVVSVSVAALHVG